MRKFTLGNLATIEDVLEFVPKGMELSFNTGTKIKYDLDFYNSSPEIQKKYANDYFTSHFPSLTFIPGFIWDSEEYGIEQLYSWTSIYDDFVVHKLPTIRLLKRRQL